MVVSTVMDRAQGQAVAHDRLAGLLDVSDDVRSLEEADFLQAADRALFSVRRNDSASESRLMDANARLVHHVPAFDRIV
jgi:hypothetical protein